MVRGVGPVIARRMLAVVGSPHRLWQIHASELRSVEGIGPQLVAALQASDPEPAARVLDFCCRHQIHVLCPDDPDYPRRLASLDDAPLVLFVRGDPGHLNHSAMLAVVGARRASREGRLIARRWSAYLSRQGIAVVSGMAYGIDAAAHAGALEGTEPTIAVLGAGLAADFAEEQLRQMAAISARGCVVSEFLPEVSARAEHFPRRNRIIAGLSDATLVIEADIHSGSLITARQAAEYGRDVFAVPGSVLAGNHAGCHLLIRDGAMLAESPDNVMDMLQWQQRKSGKQTYTPSNDTEASILSALAGQPQHLDALAETCGLTVAQLSPILLAFELQGVVERLPGSRYILNVELQNS